MTDVGRLTRRSAAHRIEVRGPAAPRVVSRPDTLTVEEPLEIRVGGRALAVTMRTPGDDFDLTLGFLLTEGVIAAAEDVDRLRHCRDGGREPGGPAGAARTRDTFEETGDNIVETTLATHVPPPAPGSARALYTSSSCGVCGKASIDAVRTRSRYAVRPGDDGPRLSPATLVGMPETLRTRQRIFVRTGGLHAAGLFTADGELLAAREDVARHNAVDKVLGWALRQGHVPLTDRVLCVSGRASFELTQKALMAGIPALVAVSAPSSLAVDLACESGMTLVGFLRDPTLSVYAGAERIDIPLDSPPTASSPITARAAGEGGWA